MREDEGVFFDYRSAESMHDLALQLDGMRGMDAMAVPTMVTVALRNGLVQGHPWTRTALLVSQATRGRERGARFFAEEIGRNGDPNTVLGIWNELLGSLWRGRCDHDPEAAGRYGRDEVDLIVASAQGLGWKPSRPPFALATETAVAPFVPAM